MKSTPLSNPRQADTSKVRTGPYCQTPLCLGRLSPGELDAAFRVWLVLHSWMRLGAAPKRVTDEDLLATPYLSSLSAEHARKGLDVLEREGLIVRTSRGSRREVSVIWRAPGAKVAQKSPESRTKVALPSHDGRTIDAPLPQVETARRLRLLMSGDQEGAVAEVAC